MANLTSFNSILRIEGVKIVKNACSTAESSLFELSKIYRKSQISFSVFEKIALEVRHFLQNYFWNHENAKSSFGISIISVTKWSSKNNDKDVINQWTKFQASFQKFVVRVKIQSCPKMRKNGKLRKFAKFCDFWSIVNHTNLTQSPWNC